MEVEEELQPTSKVSEISDSAMDSNDDDDDEGEVVLFQPFSRGAFKDRPRKKSFTSGKSDEGGEVAEIQEGPGWRRTTEVLHSRTGRILKKRTLSSDSEDDNKIVGSFLSVSLARRFSRSRSLMSFRSRLFAELELRFHIDLAPSFFLSSTSDAETEDEGETYIEADE